MTFTSTTTSVCTAGGTTITLIATGTCTIQANQAGNAIYNAAPLVARSFNVTNVVIPPPVVTAINPNSGPVTGGTSVTITGTDLNGAAGVSFGGTAAASFTVNSATSITAVAPAHAAGLVDVTVTTAGGSSAAVTADQFTFLKLDQTITFGALANKTLAQSPVTVVATAASGLAVTFTSTTPLVCTTGGTNGTTITLIAAGTCTIQADQAGNATYNAAPAVQQSFTVTTVTSTAPIVTSVSPRSGSPKGGTSVTITGRNFTNVTDVKFGDTKASSFKVKSATTIIAISPWHSPGTVDITVVTKGGPSAANTDDQFTFTALDCKPGRGYGDTNHCHGDDGPPGDGHANDFADFGVTLISSRHGAAGGTSGIVVLFALSALVLTATTLLRRKVRRELQ